MRLVRRISRPEFVTAISAEDDFHMLRRQAREDERRQDRRVRHRLVETRLRILETVEQRLLREALFDVLGIDVTRDSPRESALVELRIVEPDAEGLQTMRR